MSRFNVPELKMAAKQSSRTNQDSLTMRVTLLTIRTAFPNVKQLETEVLENWMKDGTNLILLDVREKEEYIVSHLPGAISVKPNEAIHEVMKKINDKLGETERNSCVKIVAYCALGYRSSSMAQKIYHELKRLRETEGFNLFTEVYNLEGSIFKWANEGRTMVNCQNKDTIYCHPYNILWGRLLASHIRKHEPT